MVLFIVVYNVALMIQMKAVDHEQHSLVVYRPTLYTCVYIEIRLQHILQVGIYEVCKVNL